MRLSLPFFRREIVAQKEGWPSGLRRTPGKRVGVNAPPGFESPSLRHVFIISINQIVSMVSNFLYPQFTQNLL